MYNELYEIWKRELENAELVKLPSDFYFRTADYLKKLREESRMLDKRTAKAGLLAKEMLNVKRMLRELIQTRYRKVLQKASKGERLSSEFLAAEEEKIYNSLLPFAEGFHAFAEGVLRGQISKVDFKKEHKRAVMRFLKDVPAIIGADMKTYGPFNVEDVASIPINNAKLLAKQSLAEEVDVR